MEQRIKLIADYIFDKKGIRFPISPPQNQRQFALMIYMSDIAEQYFKTKNYGV